MELVTKCDRFRKLKHSSSLPCAFTEQGVSMLSSILNSDRAVEVNIEIMHAFVRLRKMLSSHVALARKLAVLEKKYDAQFRVVFEAIRALMAEPEKPERKIGFEVREKAARYRVGKKQAKNNPAHSLRGKYKGSGLVKSLMAEKKREREL